MRLEIAFYTEGLEFTEEMAVKGPLGGSETAVAMLARALAKRGHKVRMYCNTKERGPVGKVLNNVEYCNYKMWPAMSKVVRPDVLIVSRHPQGIIMDTWPETGMTYFWMHDVMGKKYEKVLFSWMCAIDKIIVNSRYAYHQMFKASPGLRDFEREASRQHHDLVKVISLGLNQDDLPQFKDRNHRRLLYSSRPERGLAQALDTLDHLNEKRSKLDKFTLAVCGYDVSPGMLAPGMVQLYNQLEKRMKANEQVEIVEDRTRKSLYKEMARCHALLYPTDFPEIFCLTTLEAQACGLPVITTADYAPLETCPSAHFIDGFPEDKDYIAKAAQAVEDLEDKAIWSHHSAAGLNHVSKNGKFRLDWDDIAKEWEGMFRSDFQNRLQRHPLGVARALHKNSDLIACQELLKNPGDYGVNMNKDQQPEADKLLEQVTSEIGFLDDPEEYKKHYTSAENGRENKDVLSGRDSNDRMRTLANVIGDFKLPEDFTVMDWGANLGILGLSIRDRHPKAHIVSYDIDPDIVKRGEKWGIEVYKDEGKPDPDIAWVSDREVLNKTKYDLIVLAEVLEHVPDPKEFLETEVFPLLSDKGWVLISTPSGPWEFDSYEKDPKRFHVRRFRNIDVEDYMVKCGVLGQMMSTALPAGNGKEGDPLGWLIVAFQVGKKEVPAFDMHRHILTERPRLTVTACIITKDRSWQIQRMLSTVRPYVDQLIISDTGSTDKRAIEIEQDAADIWRKGGDPLKIGFGPARQESLVGATGDFILWIDSDEWLDNPQNLRRYLRENSLMGYVLFQKNLTLDGGHQNPDTPCRLFRRNCGARFIGYIHEQAELDYDTPIVPAAPLPNLSILHDSYYKQENREQRFYRNLPLLQKESKEMPQRLMTKVLLMRDFTQYGTHQIGMGQVGPGMVNIQKALDIYDKHFKEDLFKGKYFSHAWKFYQAALTGSRQGFGAAYGLVATGDPHNQDQVIPTDMLMLLFRTVDEAQKYMVAKSQDGLEEAYRRLHPNETIYHKRPSSRTIAKKSSSIDKK